MRQTVGFTTIDIDYERPSVRKRTIFGGLVPYDKIWRTGAGRNTVICFSTSVIIDEKEVPKGTYNLLSVPGKKEWEIILNNDTSLWGTYNHNPDWDVLRFTIPLENESIYFETMNIAIDVIPYDAVIHIMWENVHVKFDVKTGTNQSVYQFITDSLATSLSNDANAYFSAANHLFMQNSKLDLALNLINKSLALKETGFAYGQMAEILFQLDRKKEAIEMAKKGKLWEQQHGMDGLYFDALMDKFNSK
ncbi:MAG: tetratricopeptide (TPR) repeat protein [Cyclobacteriaceae bacterium]